MRSGALGERLSWIVQVQGLEAADSELPDLDVVCAVRNLVKNQDVRFVNDLAARRVQRHKEAVYGAWVCANADRWKWLRIPVAPPVLTTQDSHAEVFH
jgi:hypothetical protein